MNCLDCQDLLQRRLDGEAIAPTLELEQHVAECPDCRALHASAQILLDGLSALPAPASPHNFTQRLTGLVLEDRRLRLERNRRRWLVTAALAACLLVMALAGYFLLPVPRPTIAPPAMAHEIKQDEQPPRDVAAVALPLTKSADDARHAVTALSERWADKAREQTKQFLAAATPVDVPDIDHFPELAEPLDLEPAVQSLRLAGAGLAVGLEPVAQNARRALAYFFRELPVLQGK